MSLYYAFNNTTTTENGMVAYKSTGNKVLDLFGKIGSSRSTPDQALVKMFDAAYAENQELAIRTLLWARDVRGGAGERKVFRTLLKHLVEKDVKGLYGVVKLTAEVGRWDDLLELIGTSGEFLAVEVITQALRENQGLCAKWMPRQGSVANVLRKAMDLTPKQYRKLLVGLTQVVETKMCSKEWGAIEYPHVPSVAASRYAKAFGRNDPVRYQKYRDALTKGEVKINASAIFPYDVIKGSDPQIVQAQWNSLPDYMEGTDEKILAMIDVSGSMGTLVSGKTSAMDVAVSLGIYVSERLTGEFKDTFLTFTSQPRLIKATGSVQSRIQAAKRYVGYDTNLAKAFEVLLKSAVDHKVPASDMPTKLLILSDMQFNSYVICGASVSALQMIAHKYKTAGYEMPQIVFWNIADGRGSANNSPMSSDSETGVALVSGFSPSIMRSVLGSKTITPVDVMMETIMKERYDYLSVV
jgi:hypothetical protein